MINDLENMDQNNEKSLFESEKSLFESEEDTLQEFEKLEKQFKTLKDMMRIRYENKEIDRKIAIETSRDI